MMSKTHIAIGIASVYLVTQPKSMPEFAIATIGGSIGGIISDVDVKISINNNPHNLSLDALYGELLAIGISTSMLFGIHCLGNNILKDIGWNYIQSSVGVVMFVILTIIGKYSKHRDRTHSILALVLFSISVYLIASKIAFPFAIGFISHLLADLINKSEIRIFYPFKKGISFKLCNANVFINELIFIFGICIIILYAFMK